MFGYFLKTRFSPILCEDIALVNFAEPIAFGLLPEAGLGFLAPPVRTRTRIMMMPCFALYPSILALYGRVGRRMRMITASRRHSTAACLSPPEIYASGLLHNCSTDSEGLNA